MESTGLKEAIVELNSIATAAAGGTLETIEGKGVNVPIAFLPVGAGKVEACSLLDQLIKGNEYAERARLEKADGPDKRNGTANLQALESFIAHANRFKSPASAVWADAASRKLVAVLDYHPAGAASPARWGKHRGVYPCPLSEAWLAWGGGKALKLDQDDFAALLDSRDRELAVGKLPSGKEAPDPSTLVTLASNLEVYSTATAKRERDPNTGRLKISYSEDKGVNGTVMPPPSFLIGIPVFQDAAPQPLEVRLGVTVEEGRAKFSVQIHAAGDVLRTAFAGLCARVQRETELPVFVGTPE